MLEEKKPIQVFIGILYANRFDHFQRRSMGDANFSCTASTLLIHMTLVKWM